MPAEHSPFYLPPAERPRLDPGDVLAVVVVVNGSLGMSPGKVAAQAFQGCLALVELAGRQDARSALLDAWKAQGRRTIVRVAETPGLFQRVLDEVDGVVMHDEGLTEVADGAATVFCSFPHRRADTPKILTHKRVGLM
jgi:peptidyl-tRNA hydrolase